MLSARFWLGSRQRLIKTSLQLSRRNVALRSLTHSRWKHLDHKKSKLHDFRSVEQDVDTLSNEVKNLEKDLGRFNAQAKARRQLFATSSSFLESLKLRIKWFLIKQNRPFNADDLSAFASWFLWSNILWFILGTTTFFSLVLYTVRTFNSDKNTFLDRLVLKMLFKYDSDKLDISFKQKDKESIKPNMRKGVIRLENLRIESSKKTGTKFMLDVKTIDFTLSFRKWYQGKGLVKDVEIDGVSGYINNNTDTVPFADHAKYMDHFISLVLKNHDYEFNNIKLTHLSIDYQRQNLDPLKIEIFNLELPKLRVNWFLLDVLKPKICSGSLNNSLFNIHQKQLLEDHNILLQEDEYDHTMTRIQLHNMDVKHNQSLFQKFNWISEGKVNVICDVSLPNEKSFDIYEIIKGLKDLAKDISNSDLVKEVSPFLESKLGTKPDNSEKSQVAQSKNKYIVINLKLQFINAIGRVPDKLPVSRNNEPFISLEELKPVVALINSDSSEDSVLSKSNAVSILTPVETSGSKNSDKQFILKSSTILDLNDLYNKFSFSETNITDTLVADLYEDLSKNLSYELNSKLAGGYNRGFTLSHLLSALGKNGKVLSNTRSNGFLSANDADIKISLLVLLGLGALF